MFLEGVSNWLVHPHGIWSEEWQRVARGGCSENWDENPARTMSPLTPRQWWGGFLHCTWLIDCKWYFILGKNEFEMCLAQLREIFKPLHSEQDEQNGFWDLVSPYSLHGTFSLFIRLLSPLKDIPKFCLLHEVLLAYKKSYDLLWNALFPIFTKTLWTFGI